MSERLFGLLVIITDSLCFFCVFFGCCFCFCFVIVLLLLFVFCVDDTRGVRRCSGHAPWHVDSGLISSPHYSLCTVHMFNDGVFQMSE